MVIVFVPIPGLVSGVNFFFEINSEETGVFLSTCQLCLFGCVDVIFFAYKRILPWDSSA